MRILTAELESVSPYSQSGFFTSKKKDKEGHDVFEERCWRERMHVNKNGHVFIPPMQMKFSIDEATKRLALKVPGQGKTLYTKFMEAGTFVKDPIDLGIKADDVPGEWFWCHADGKRGSGTRVRRCFPMIDNWKGTLIFYVIDDKLPEHIVEQCVESAGMFVGIGRFRPMNQGFNGRFRPIKFTWS